MMLEEDIVNNTVKKILLKDTVKYVKDTLQVT